MIRYLEVVRLGLWFRQVLGRANDARRSPMSLKMNFEFECLWSAGKARQSCAELMLSESSCRGSEVGKSP
jgi:hypothetical protein